MSHVVSLCLQVAEKKKIIKPFFPPYIQSANLLGVCSIYSIYLQVTGINFYMSASFVGLQLDFS